LFKEGTGYEKLLKPLLISFLMCKLNTYQFSAIYCSGRQFSNRVEEKDFKQLQLNQNFKQKYSGKLPSLYKHPEIISCHALFKFLHHFLTILQKTYLKKHRNEM